MSFIYRNWLVGVHCVKDGKWSGCADEVNNDGVTYSGLSITAPRFSGKGAKAKAEEWLKKEIDKSLNKEVDDVSVEPK